MASQCYKRKSNRSKYLESSIDLQEKQEVACTACTVVVTALSLEMNFYKAKYLNVSQCNQPNECCILIRQIKNFAEYVKKSDAKINRLKVIKISFQRREAIYRMDLSYKIIVDRNLKASLNNLITLAQTELENLKGKYLSN